MQLRLLSPPKNSAEAIQSRRQPCYGFAIIADVQDAGKEQLLALLTETRNAIVKIMDPTRTNNHHRVRSPHYIKQKFFHAAVFGMQPLLDKDQFISVFYNKNGLLNNSALNRMCSILQSHLLENEPYLTPVKCELMDDGTIIARFTYKTKNELNDTPLLTLARQLDPEKTFSKWDANNHARSTTVAIALCVINKDSISEENLIFIHHQLEQTSQALLLLGTHKINQFNLISKYDKRTLSPRHTTTFAKITL